MRRLARVVNASIAALIVTTISGNCALSADQRKLESDGKHHWLFPNHPRWRRIAKASGFGVATGGILGPILGVGAVAGATAGAAEHGGVRAWKDKHDVKRGKHLDQHIW